MINTPTMTKKDQFIHIDEHGTKHYYSDRKMKILHREDGPAFEDANGGKAWFINGKYHREDGPAFEDVNGYKEWYLNNERLTEEEFNTRMNPVELTLQEIAEKFGVSVDKLKIINWNEVVKKSKETLR
jgi:hypothetical protein